MGRTVQAISTK